VELQRVDRHNRWRRRWNVGLASQTQTTVKEIDMRKGFLIAVAILLLGISESLGLAADTNSTETNVNVAASTTVVSKRESRRYLALFNLSDTTIYCKFGGRTAVVGEGYVFNPQPAAGQSGGLMLLDSVIPLGQFSCIHNSTGNKVISFVEGG